MSEKNIRPQVPKKRWQRIRAKIAEAKRQANCAKVLYILDRLRCKELHDCKHSHMNSIANIDTDAAAAYSKRYEEMCRKSAADAINAVRARNKEILAENSRLRAENEDLKKVNDIVLNKIRTWPLVRMVSYMRMLFHFAEFQESVEIPVNTLLSAIHDSSEEALPSFRWLPTVMDAYSFHCDLILGNKNDR